MKFTSPVYSTASGSIAGITYSHNRYGMYTRARTYPVDPASVRQVEMRALFATMVTAWLDTLTAVQRTAWNTWAANTPITGKDGMPINITGQNAYIRFNTARLQSDDARVDAAPIIFNNGNPVSGIHMTVAGTPNAYGLNVGDTALSVTLEVNGGASDDGKVAFYQSIPVNATRNFFKGPYQLCSLASIAAAETEKDISSLYTALLSDNGVPVADQVRGIRARVIYDDGRLSEAFRILAPVVQEVA